MTSLASKQNAMLATSWREHALYLTELLWILKKELFGGKVIAHRPELTLFPFRLQMNSASFEAGQVNAQPKKFSPPLAKRLLCAWTVLSRRKISFGAFKPMRSCSMNIQSFGVRLNF